MHIIERGRAFREWLRGLATRTPWDWRRCPRCRQMDTWRHGTYTRLRLSHGRNQRSEVRLERAALVWAISHTVTPAQERSERTRHYRRPGQSPLTLAGVPPGTVSYLDALAV